MSLARLNVEWMNEWIEALPAEEIGNASRAPALMSRNCAQVSPYGARAQELSLYKTGVDCCNATAWIIVVGAAGDGNNPLNTFADKISALTLEEEDDSDSDIKLTRSAADVQGLFILQRDGW